MKIKESFGLDNVITAGYFLTVVIILIYQVSSLSEKYTELADDEVPFQRAIDNLRVGTLRVVASTSEYLLLKAEAQHNPEKPDHDRRYLEEEEQELRKEGTEAIERALKDFKHFTGHKNYRQDFLTPLEPLLTELLSRSHALIQLKQKDAKGQEILEGKEELEKLEREILNLIGKIDAIERTHFQHILEDFESSLKILLVFGLISILVFILLTIFRHKSMANKVFEPLGNLEKDINAIRHGDVHILEKLNLQLGSYEIDMIRQSLHDLVSQNEKNLLRLSVAKQRAEEANKAKSQFLANMSHELRTPMHAIHNFTNLSLKYAENDKQKRFLENTRVSAIRLTSLLNNLLDLSKLEEGRMNATFNEQDLTALTLNCVEELESLLDEKQINVVMDQETVHSGMFDQMLISQVLINLLSNAIKFSPEKSDVHIRLSTLKKTIDGQEDNYLRLEVIDQGVGIPVGETEAVFDKFIQSSKTMTRAGGTGLGLSISREIIKLHQGRLWAESPPQGEYIGSAFIFQIPVVHRDTRVVESIHSGEVIKSHLELKNAVISVLEGNRGAETIPSDFLMNEGRTLLDDWINKHQSYISNADILRLCHDEFHMLSAEIIGLCQLEKNIEARQKQDDLISHSNKLVRLLQSQLV